MEKQYVYLVEFIDEYGDAYTESVHRSEEGALERIKKCTKENEEEGVLYSYSVHKFCLQD